MEEKKPKSPFFEAATEGLQKAFELKQEGDAAVVIVADKHYSAAMIGGNVGNIQESLIGAMRKDPIFADTLIRSVANFLLLTTEKPTLSIHPVPEDGVADKTSPQPGRYRIGVDIADDNKKGS